MSQNVHFRRIVVRIDLFLSFLVSPSWSHFAFTGLVSGFVSCWSASLSVSWFYIYVWDSELPNRQYSSGLWTSNGTVDAPGHPSIINQIKRSHQWWLVSHHQTMGPLSCHVMSCHAYLLAINDWLSPKSAGLVPIISATFSFFLRRSTWNSLLSLLLCSPTPSTSSLPPSSSLLFCFIHLY